MFAPSSPMAKGSKVKINIHKPYKTMASIDKTKFILAVLVALVVGGLAGNWYGGKNGYQRGYQKAEADIKAIGEAAAKKATDEAAKAANPFQAVNPLEGVEANPFEKAKKVLNPFE